MLQYYFLLRIEYVKDLNNGMKATNHSHFPSSYVIFSRFANNSLFTARAKQGARRRALSTKYLIPGDTPFHRPTYGSFLCQYKTLMKE
jgi:hypothetical protein